jgi:hypothetical protein
MRYKFNVGDRVRVLDGSKIEEYTYGWFMEDAVGKKGIITACDMIGKYPAYQIKFDDRDFWRYNDCIFDERGLEFVGFDAINFYIVGRKVYARMCDSNGKVVTAVTRCHPDDDFDLKTGMNIALDRLLAKASLYNGKVVCVENNGHMRFAFTKGKIYTIANGEIKDDYGMTPFRKIKSLDEFDEIEGLHFIPLVE